MRDPAAKYALLALLSTNPEVEAKTILRWFVQCWQVEVTLEEAHRHLGLVTQRQWSDAAIAHTPPILLGLFSWVVLVAHALYTSQQAEPSRQVAWYPKTTPAFSDAIAQVRTYLWSAYPTVRTSTQPTEMLKIPKPFCDTLISALAYAA